MFEPITIKSAFIKAYSNNYHSWLE